MSAQKVRCEAAFVLIELCALGRIDNNLTSLTCPVNTILTASTNDILEFNFVASKSG
jgi:hypothetical protein